MMRSIPDDAPAPIRFTGSQVRRGDRERGSLISVPHPLNEQKDLVRKHFALQARAYPGSAKYRHAEKAQPMIELADPVLKDTVLDVATGWGFVALAFAPLVRSVIGLDLTPEMVELAKKLAHERGDPNVEFRVGDAEDLPFDAGSFDLVTCRAAFDHLGNPEKALREMKRVLAPRGRIVLYEFVAPAALDKAHTYHVIESSRDPSHLWSSSIHEFEDLFWSCGLEEQGRVITLLKRDFDSWMSVIDADAETRKKVRMLLEDSMFGDRAGLAPRIRAGSLTFTQTCVAWQLSAKKSDGEGRSGEGHRSTLLSGTIRGKERTPG
jgi:ubiquinone/menaquinone biosynthesis C-methylase UbiE